MLPINSLSQETLQTGNATHNGMKQSQLEQHFCSKRRSTGESGPNKERPSPAKNLHE
jgi:hypothetical protein